MNPVCRAYQIPNGKVAELLGYRAFWDDMIAILWYDKYERKMMDMRLSSLASGVSFLQNVLVSHFLAS